MDALIWLLFFMVGALWLLYGGMLLLIGLLFRRTDLLKRLIDLSQPTGGGSSGPAEGEGSGL